MYTYVKKKSLPGVFEEFGNCLSSKKNLHRNRKTAAVQA
jgi:hypothetical protein